MIAPGATRLIPAFSCCSHYSSTQRRNLNFRCMSVRTSEPLQSVHPQEGRDMLLRTVLRSMESIYLRRNPTAVSVLDLLRSSDGSDAICYDHVAFRTFGMNEHGIDSMARFFLDSGYRQREELNFPKKKLKAIWFSPPDDGYEHVTGDAISGPLPRIFISELLVHEMSPETQDIIANYVSGKGCKYAPLASAVGNLPWRKPSHSDYMQLARESEYAAWTLVNGYAINHVTVSTHRLKSQLKSIHNINKLIESSGFKLNAEGNVLKVSPDGLLLQSSTVADTEPYEFSDDIVDSVALSYIEFAERLVLPQYKHLPLNEIKERHRRDGFEVGNADKIFESTSRGQMTR